MLKILFLTRESSDSMRMIWRHSLEQEISKIAECKWAGYGWPMYKKGESMVETVNRVAPDVDWVIWDRIWGTLPKKRNFKIALTNADIHYNFILKMRPAEIVKKLNQDNYDAFLMRCTELAAQMAPIAPIEHDFYLKRLNAPILHAPFSQDPAYFHPMKTKVYDAVFIGSHNNVVYPIRQAIFQGLPALAKEHNWKILIGDRLPKDTGKYYKSIKNLYGQGFHVGPRYVQTLATSKTFLFCTSVFKYPLKKIFEGMACKTCCFFDTPLTAKALHLIPDWNFVEINRENWKDKLKYYLNHDAERETIAENGYKTFLKYHTSQVRARQLVDFLGGT